MLRSTPRGLYHQQQLQQQEDEKQKQQPFAKGTGVTNGTNKLER